MNCPHCNRVIPDKAIARHLASKGGKRTTPAKKRANAERIKAYWARVRAGETKR
jgi:hypothetical protein